MGGRVEAESSGALWGDPSSHVATPILSRQSVTEESWGKLQVGMGGHGSGKGCVH